MITSVVTFAADPTDVLSDVLSDVRWCSGSTRRNRADVIGTFWDVIGIIRDIIGVFRDAISVFPSMLDGWSTHH